MGERSGPGVIASLYRSMSGRVGMQGVALPLAKCGALMMPIVPFYGISVDKFVQKLWLVMNN